VLVYRFDPRFPEKQRIASKLLRDGITRDAIRVPHQAIAEFVAAVSRPIGRARPLLSIEDACREAEEMLQQFEVLYPNETIVRTAIRGVMTYRLSWSDAHLWAYAEYYGLSEIVSDDYHADRVYGTVRIVNPFGAHVKTAGGQGAAALRRRQNGR
jgi:predicted nucleic acid-binding protein